MAKGTEIDKLYVSLGLDINDLKLGFDTAGKTVNQAIAKLNSENKKIKLQTDIDLNKIKGYGSELDQIRIKYESINRQLDIQKQKEQILQAQLQSAVKSHGSDHYITSRAEMALLNQQKNVAGLESQLRALGSQLNNIPTKSNTAFSSLSKGASQARQGIGKLADGYTLLNAKLAAFMAVAGTGAGLFNITKDAMMAGNSVYKLQKRLNVSTAEAGELKRVFSLAGSDINSLTPFITKIDKALLGAGESGNATTQALERFGIALTNEYGQLLPINEQLEQLAKGYKNASEAGEVEAFTAEVLGARGSALIPVLEEYTDLLQISKSVKTTGLLNPQATHETYLEWQKMEMEMSQLKLALGSALLPVSKEMMPEIIEMFESWITLIRDNKENIQLMGEILIDSMKTAGDAIQTVADALEAVGVNGENVGNVLKDIKAVFDAGYGGALLAYAGNPTMMPLIGATLMTFDDVRQQREANDQQAEAQKALKAYYADIDKRSQERQRQIQRETQAQKAQQKQQEEQAKATAEMYESMYSLSHTDLQTQLHSIDVSMQKWKEKGVAEAEIEKATQQQKAKIIKEFNDNVVSKINSVWKSAYQNRLDEIEKEKQAWQQKGVDEVKATEWAEEQKRQLQQETALSMFKQNYKYLKLYRKAMAGGGSEEEKQANAINSIIGEMRKDANLPADAWTTKQEIAGFSQAMKQANNNIIPIYDSMPTQFIYKGTDAIPMFSPEYQNNMQNLNTATARTATPQEDINYNLNVRVEGLEDVSNEVAQSACKKIFDILPNNTTNINISYGGA